MSTQNKPESGPSSPRAARRPPLVATHRLAFRHIVVHAALLLVTLLSVHALTALTRSAGGLAFQHWAPAAARLTWVALALGFALGLLPRWSKQSVWAAVGLGAAGALVMAWDVPASGAPAWVLPVLAPALLRVRDLILARVPSWLDSAGRARPRWVYAWLVLAGLALLQMGRLSTYMQNPESDWFLSTKHALYAKHECANAYFHAAELMQRGETNIYHPHHYPGLNPQAEPHTDMAHMLVEDPYLYPPPFLMLPSAVRAFTHDFAAVRVVWFVLNVALCMGAVLGLAVFIGGRAGRIAALASPLLLVAFPVLHNFQYGQFHFAAIALSILAMLAFEKQKVWTGGALLAVAILSKVFPLFLLIPLIAQKNVRAVGTTLSMGLALSGAALLWFGWAPYDAFFSFQLPRLESGSAFAFDQAWPELAHLVIAGNQGVAGIFAKLNLLGLPLPGWLGSAITLTVALTLGAVLLSVGARQGRLSRWERACLWLSALGVASLLSRGAWSDYVPLTAVWLLTLLVPVALQSKLRAAAWLLVAVFQMTLLGTMPLGDFQDQNWLLAGSLLGAALLYLCFAAGLTLPLLGAARRRAHEAGCQGADRSRKDSAPIGDASSVAHEPAPLSA